MHKTTKCSKETFNVFDRINKLLPITLPLISLILGIYWQSKFPINVYILYLTVLISLSLLTWTHLKQTKSYSKYIVCLLTFISGSFIFQAKKDNNLFLLNKYSNKNLELTAKITNIEYITGQLHREVLKIVVLDNKKKLSSSATELFNVLIYSRQKTFLEIDDIISIKNIKIISKKRNRMLTNKPTFQDYLFKENLLASIFLKNNKLVKLLHRPKYSINRWINNKKNQIYNSLKKKLSKKSFSYLSTIFFGNKNLRDNDVRNIFKTWGLTHYLARSGLHIVIFILIWTLILNIFISNIYLRILLLLLLSIVYSTFSWPSISFYRAFYVFFIVQIGKLLNKQISFLHILSIVCLLTLLLNPYQLFFLDFQLSFALTFTLGLINFQAKQS